MIREYRIWKRLVLLVLILGIVGINSVPSKAIEFGLAGKDVRIPLTWITEPVKNSKEFTHGPGNYGRKLKFGGMNRFYEIHVPPEYNKSTPTPVVLIFHGGGGYPSAVRYESGMDRTADRNGFIVVYPAGSTKRLLKDRLLLWNDGRPYRDGTYIKADDVGFVAALLDDLKKLFNVNTKMIYACGYSNGAQFTYRLAKRLTDRIAAIATVAGQRPANDSFDPPPSRPISIMQFAGLQDRIGPYHGGKPQTFTPELKADGYSIKESIESWVAFNKCPSKPTEVKRIGKAIMERYGPCQDGTEVILWTLEDGGHTWPGGDMLPAEVKLGGGNINRDISASDLMWAFFERHQLP